MDRLKRYRWPGNVRELENLVRRLAVLYPQDTITRRHHRFELEPSLLPPQPALRPQRSSQQTRQGCRTPSSGTSTDYFRASRTRCRRRASITGILREIEGPLIGAALAATRGNQIGRRSFSGVNRNTLRKKIRDLELQVVRANRESGT